LWIFLNCFEDDDDDVPLIGDLCCYLFCFPICWSKKWFLCCWNDPEKLLEKNKKKGAKKMKYDKKEGKKKGKKKTTELEEVTVI
jgi:hypothetical protein